MNYVRLFTPFAVLGIALAQGPNQQGCGRKAMLEIRGLERQIRAAQEGVRNREFSVLTAGAEDEVQSAGGYTRSGDARLVPGAQQGPRPNGMRGPGQPPHGGPEGDR